MTAFRLELAMLVAALGAGGCATRPAAIELVMLEPRDGAIYVRPSEINRYQCSIGLLVCTSESGRTSTRRCQCVE